MLTAVLCGASSASAATFKSGQGLEVKSVKWLSPRLAAVVVATNALPRPANIYVLLPPRYDERPKKRWPVFYLLHGTSGGASDWVKAGDADKVIGNREVITVMPDIALNVDGGGWCTDWPNGQEKWETFHIGQLLPWVQSNLRTIDKRGERAIAGLSQGGFCSLSYAARHPDLFGTALGYSGAPDIYNDPEARAGAKLIINGTEMGLTRVPPDTFFGNWATDGINWAAHDPATLAENLRSTRMYMYWGNGQPGPLDQPSQGLPAQMAIERAVAQSNDDFRRRLESLRIPAFFDAYGAGTHAWAYWKRDLQQSIDKIMSDFARPAPNPTQFTYTSADDRYGVYGWSVGVKRTAREFSTLGVDGCTRFSLSGSGDASVTTKRCFKRGGSYRVKVSGSGGTTRKILTVDRSGRLTVRIPLGPANPYQEETAQAKVAGTAVYTTYVSVARVRPSR